MSIICTIPRSGTNLLYYFFKYLELFALAPELLGKPDSEIFSKFKDKSDYELVGKSLIIGHGHCPGYEKNVSNPWHQQWSKLPDSNNWFNALSTHKFNDKANFDFHKNHELKVVFVYRNPYDCLLSLYDHLQEHKNYNLVNKSLDDFAIDVFPNYIKSYISFREMKLKFKDNILLVSYEDLVEERKEYFSEICQFISIDIQDNFDSAFEQAYEYTDISKMKSLEKFMGQTLAGDQKQYDPSKSHIRAINRTEERGNFSEKSKSYISAMMKKFNIFEFAIS